MHFQREMQEKVMKIILHSLLSHSSDFLEKFLRHKCFKSFAFKRPFRSPEIPISSLHRLEYKTIKSDSK